MSTNNRMTPRSSQALAASANGFSALKSPKTRQERQERQTNFKVVIRVRPPLPRELNGDVPFQNIIAIDDREQCITVSENLDAVLDEDGQVLANPGPYSTHSFMFDYVYDQNSSQKKVYETMARSVVDSSLQGYNATIFAYGQTGTGKTFTMEGFNREGSVEARGIIPRAIEQIFGHIQRFASPRMRFLVRASYLQIYNETISDLLKPERNNLSIRENKTKGVFVDNLSEWVVRSPAEIYGLMERGGAVRATGETKMNEASSRSHAVFIVIAEQSETVYVDERGQEMSPEAFQQFMHGRGVRREQEMAKLEDHVRQSFKVGKLNLVDLAGSERVRLSGATGQRLEECKQINSSLSHLGAVISALTDPKSRQHVPYRNSKLTRMLEDSLGGNCKTTMMAMVSPAAESMLETISTLKFANRAKNIRNEARVNEDLDQKSLLRKYERELKQLRAELEERSKNVVDKRKLLELEDQRKRAEADKMAAIRALEARSLEFMHAKEEKKKLEARIASLMGQMIRGEDGSGGGGGGQFLNPDGSTSGGGGGGGPELHVVMKEQQDRLRQEYEHKLAGLERERETIEEEKAQVDRYKQLLLKQRDIMIALTQRLVERDEQIMALQDELDAYDRHHRELEERLDEKTASLIKMQRIAMEVNASSPVKSGELGRAIDGDWAAREGPRRSGATELVADNDDESSTSAAGATRGEASTAALEEKIRGLNVLMGGQRAKIGALEGQLAEEGRQSAGRAGLLLQSELEAALRRLENDPSKAELREPLAAIVSQVATRLRDGQQRGAAPSRSANDQELSALRSEVASLRAQNSQLELRGGGGGDVSALQSRCESLTKDREAVQTILEHKIRVLVQSVAQAAGALVASSPQGAAPGGAADLLTKDITALQRLVSASIAALRNAAAATAPISSNQQPPAYANGVAEQKLPQPLLHSSQRTAGNANRSTADNSSSRYAAPSPTNYTAAPPSNYTAVPPSNYGAAPPTNYGAAPPTNYGAAPPSYSPRVDGSHDYRQPASNNPYLSGGAGSASHYAPQSGTALRIGALPSPARPAPGIPLSSSNSSSSGGSGYNPSNSNSGGSVLQRQPVPSYRPQDGPPSASFGSAGSVRDNYYASMGTSSGGGGVGGGASTGSTYSADSYRRS